MNTKVISTKNYGNISISQDYNILFDIAKNKGPEKSLVIFGYSGWGRWSIRRRNGKRSLDFIRY